MNRIILSAILLFAGVIPLWGCGNDSQPTKPILLPTLDTVFVDASNSGDENGSQANPYNTVTEGISAAKDDAVIYIAAGNYSSGEANPIYLKAGLQIIGSGRETTILLSDLTDTSHGNTQAIQLSAISFPVFSFDRPAAAGSSPVTNTMRHCRAAGIDIDHGGGFNWIIDSCRIDHEINFTHGPGPVVNRITCCSLGTGIFMSQDDGSIDSIVGNKINGRGIRYTAGATAAYIAGNELNGGLIYDDSGPGEQIIKNNIISSDGSYATSDQDRACLAALGNGLIIKGNNLTPESGVSGIKVYSGPETIIDSNTITAVQTQSETTYGIYCNSGGGRIVGNTIRGGYYGLFDVSLSDTVMGNSIDSAHNGLFAQSGALYRGNAITQCTGDGLILTGGAAGPIENNIITFNAGAGVLVETLSDLGGGHLSGTGGNIIRNNGSWDLVNNTSVIIYARNNEWDHDDATQIDAIDIYDDEQNPGNSGEVYFVPFINPDL